jgi:glycosyltransferase involved in cell wall biosynthesis
MEPKKNKTRIAVVTTGFDQYRLNVFEQFSVKTGAQVVIFRFTDWWWRTPSGKVVVKQSQHLGFKIPFGLLKDDMYIHFDPRIPLAVLTQPWNAVIGYGYGSLTSILTAGVAKLRCIPFILWSDARLEYEVNRPWLTRMFKRMLHQLATHFIASGTAARIFLESQGIPRDRISLAPYAIDNKQMIYQAALFKRCAQGIRSELGIEQDAVVILYVGRMVRYKGVEDLVRAYAKVKRRICKVVLVLVGDGPDRRYFQECVSALGLDDVYFVGGVKHSMIGRYYAIGDLFVLPSHRDVWGKVVNEAMLFGLPIIVTSDVGAH